MSYSSREAWRNWWDEEGSGMRPLPNEDAEQFARRMTEIAWANGAFWRRPDIDRLRAELVATKDELATNADELAAMQKQRDEATAWRPIETAPMDGTVVMLYGHGRVTVGSWVAEHDIMVNEYDRSTGDYLGSHLSGETLPAYWQSHDGGFTEEHPPTHWMPLPQPPREKEGGGA